MNPETISETPRSGASFAAVIPHGPCRGRLYPFALPRGDRSGPPEHLPEHPVRAGAPFPQAIMQADMVTILPLTFTLRTTCPGLRYGTGHPGALSGLLVAGTNALIPGRASRSMGRTFYVCMAVSVAALAAGFLVLYW